MVQQSITLKACITQIRAQFEKRRIILRGRPIGLHRVSRTAGPRAGGRPVMGFFFGRREKRFLTIATLAIAILLALCRFGLARPVIRRGGCFEAGLGSGSCSNRTPTLNLAAHWSVPGFFVGVKWVIGELGAFSRTGWQGGRRGLSRGLAAGCWGEWGIHSSGSCSSRFTAMWFGCCCCSLLRGANCGGRFRWTLPLKQLVQRQCGNRTQ